MCGRYANSTNTAGIYGAFDIDEVIGEELEPSWNIAPTDPVRAVVQRPPRQEHLERREDPDDQGNHRGDRADERAGAPGVVRQLRTFRWGLVPSWSKDRKGAARLINARRETVVEKPAFRTAAGRRRCLLPADGYYEWQQTPDGKIPYFLHAADDGQLAFAGLYELWPDPALPDDSPDRWLWTCTVITQQATDTLGEIHDRCPVIVPAQWQSRWLDCSTGDAGVAAALLDELPVPKLEPRVVSTEVNSVRNNGPQLVRPVQPPDQAARPLGLDFEG